MSRMAFEICSTRARISICCVVVQHRAAHQGANRGHLADTPSHPAYMLWQLRRVTYVRCASILPQPD
jgi:hypothetical protein